MSTETAPVGPGRAPNRHRLSLHDVAALTAGGGDEEAVAHLLAAERSWRLIQLRAVLDAVRAHPDVTGPLPPVDQAWQLLVEAERRAPAEVGEVLGHPQAGTWATFTLRRLRVSDRDDPPLWVDVGYLHAMAAAAAIRARLDFALRIPVRDGFAFVPTLGGAWLPGTATWEHAEIRAAAGTATIRAGDATVRVATTGTGADGWAAVPSVGAVAAGRTFQVTLDVLSPYRNLRAPTPPDRWSDAQVDRWQSLLAGAWQLIVDVVPTLAGPLARGLFSVVPQPATERFRTMSASAGDAFGTLIVSELRDSTELAVTLVHEFQHIKLGALLHLTPLHEGEPAQRLYAPWRDDPRPLSGLLQGVYAFAGITGFWRALRRSATGPTGRLAQFEFARWRHLVWATLSLLRPLPQLTDMGRRLVSGLTETVAPWQDEPVPPELLAAAHAAAADHRALWRLHHLRPDPAVVAELAAAWGDGRDRPAVAYPEPVVAPDGSARRLDTRAVVTLWQLTDPDGFARLRRDPPAVGAHVTGASPADLAYVAGEFGHARDRYLAELAAEPERPGAWAGLGLVQAATRPGPAAAALRDCPELVRAVHRSLRSLSGAPVHPIELADWLGGLPSPAAT